MKVVNQILVIILIFLANSASAQDSDGNGFEDALEYDLAKIFVPAVQLDYRDQGTSPEPIEFIEADLGNSIYVRYFPLASGQLIEDVSLKTYGHLWNPPLIPIISSSDPFNY